MADAVAGGLDTRFKLSAKLSTGTQLGSSTCINLKELQSLVWRAAYACLVSVTWQCAGLAVRTPAQQVQACNWLDAPRLSQLHAGAQAT